MGGGFSVLDKFGNYHDMNGPESQKRLDGFALFGIFGAIK